MNDVRRPSVGDRVFKPLRKKAKKYVFDMSAKLFRSKTIRFESGSGWGRLGLRENVHGGRFPRDEYYFFLLQRHAPRTMHFFFTIACTLHAQNDTDGCGRRDRPCKLI